MPQHNINRRALSSDGYIINQRLLKNLPYGMKQSNYNGCGWIAAYNFLRACGRKKDWDTVRQQLEDSLILGGLLGTHIVQMYLYLRRHGFHLHWAVGRKAARPYAEGCKAGVLFYFNGAALHFVTFLPATEAEVEQFAAAEQAEKRAEALAAEKPIQAQWYRFLNGKMGAQRDYATMEDFLERESQTPVFVQITTAER